MGISSRMKPWMPLIVAPAAAWLLLTGLNSAGLFPWRALGRGAAAPTAAAAAPDPVESGPRRPHRPPRPGEVREMTIKRLGNFRYRPGQGIPDDVRRLDGMQVRLRGYMLLMNQSTRVTRFALVPTLGTCCYGQPPGVEHIVVVDCPPGKAADFSPDELIVQGTLHVGEQRDEGQLVGLYAVDAASVKPITQ